MSKFFADDADTISRLIEQNRRKKEAMMYRKCFMRTPGLVSMDCWCFRAGPGGENLPCPPHNESTEF
jgi:hypothetical protein